MTGILTHVHCTVCCYSTGSICHSFLLHPEGWRSWMARPWSTIRMTQSPLWYQVRRMWWVGGAPESAESDQGGSPGDRICNKHWNTYWLNYSSIINEWFITLTLIRKHTSNVMYWRTCSFMYTAHNVTWISEKLHKIELVTAENEQKLGQLLITQ